MSSNAGALREYIEFMASDAWGNNPLARFILEHGQAFEPAPLPADVSRGEPKNCFANSGKLAVDNERFVLVEGYALSLIPVEHAWLWDTQTGKLVDPTWRDDVARDAAYFGIPIQRDYLVGKILENRVWGVVFSYWDQYSILQADPSEFKYTPENSQKKLSGTVDK